MPSPAILELWVSPQMDELIKDTLSLEIEILQGQREELENEVIYLKIKITDPEKQAKLKDMMSMLMFNQRHGRHNLN